MNSTIISSIGFIFLLVGFASAAYFLVKIKKAIVSKKWPSVFGDLESSDLRKVVYRGVDSNGISDQASALVADFRYNYEVNGKSFVGSRVTFSDSVNKTKSSLKKLQQRYHAKEHIFVYYNPNNHYESVLVPGVTIYNFTPLITSSLFILVAMYLFNM